MNSPSSKVISNAYISDNCYYRNNCNIDRMATFGTHWRLIYPNSTMLLGIYFIASTHYHGDLRPRHMIVSVSGDTDNKNL
jgi:hypothetical protein